MWILLHLKSCLTQETSTGSVTKWKLEIWPCELLQIFTDHMQVATVNFQRHINDDSWADFPKDSNVSCIPEMISHQNMSMVSMHRKSYCSFRWFKHLSQKNQPEVKKFVRKPLNWKVSDHRQSPPPPQHWSLKQPPSSTEVQPLIKRNQNKPPPPANYLNRKKIFSGMQLILNTWKAKACEGGKDG